jgi:hypothetical protein
MLVLCPIYKMRADCHPAEQTDCQLAGCNSNVIVSHLRPVIIVFRLGVVVAGGQFLFPICAPKTDGFLDGGGHGPAGGGAGPRG